MKLYIKQKVFSWKDRFFIMDEAGNDCYYVEGEIFTLGKKLHVYDMAGREVAFIHQKVFSFMPRFFIEIGGNTVEIVKEFTLFKPRFHFGGLPWTMEGDFFAHEYTLYDNDGVVMELSKHWMTWGDSYELNIYDENDALMCLCVTLAVDCVLAQQNRGN